MNEIDVLEILLEIIEKTSTINVGTESHERLALDKDSLIRQINKRMDEIEF